jgi:hypothetical protein
LPDAAHKICARAKTPAGGSKNYNRFLSVTVPGMPLRIARRAGGQALIVRSFWRGTLVANLAQYRRCARTDACVTDCRADKIRAV